MPMYFIFIMFSEAPSLDSYKCFHQIFPLPLPQLATQTQAQTQWYDSMVTQQLLGWTGVYSATGISFCRLGGKSIFIYESIFIGESISIGERLTCLGFKDLNPKLVQA
jgi:hypothetical protein